MLLDAAHLLYLATRRAPKRWGSEAEIGDFSRARPPTSSICGRPRAACSAAVRRRADSVPQALAALFTLAGAESVREVRVDGDVVFAC